MSLKIFKAFNILLLFRMSWLYAEIIIYPPINDIHTLKCTHTVHTFGNKTNI